MKNKVMQLVNQICNTQSTGCRSLNKSDLARKLLDLANVPETADIQEIPVDWDNCVDILFLLPNDNSYYSLAAGIGTSGEYELQLAIVGVLDGDVFDPYDQDELIPIDYFSGERLEMYDLIDTIICDTACLAVENSCLSHTECMEEYTEQFNDGVFEHHARVWLGCMVEEGNKKAVAIMKNLIRYNLYKANLAA